MIIGQDNMAQNEVVIKVDDLLISDCAYDLDDAKNHYDIRSIYSTELGRAMLVPTISASRVYHSGTAIRLT